MEKKLEALCECIEDEARKEDFSIDTEVYETVKKDPLKPILFHGNLESSICFFARDLGRDEVSAGQPLYGAAGRLVRGGVYKFLYGKETKKKEELQEAADQILLTNTVPYKPVGNKAYSAKVKKRFRPFLEIFITNYWKGDTIISLGGEAMKWFAPYAEDKNAFTAFCKSQEKFEKTFELTLTCEEDGKKYEKKAILAPLPHPSPLNQKYYKIFPQMLLTRLEQLKK